MPDYDTTYFNCNTVYPRNYARFVIVVFSYGGLPTSIRITSMSLAQRYDCHNVNEATLKDIGEVSHDYTKNSWCDHKKTKHHDNDVIMNTMASQITSLTIVYSSLYSGADQRKHRSSASLAFAKGIHRWLVNSPHKGPVTWKMFPFDDVIIQYNRVYILWDILSILSSCQPYTVKPLI